MHGRVELKPVMNRAEQRARTRQAGQPPANGPRGRKTVVCVIGTRPEAIKMAPVVRALRAAPWARCRVVLTGQHRELADAMLAFFGITADVDLDAMRPGQTLPDLTARLLTGLDDALADEAPDLVLAQGDTTTVLAAALASFYRRVPFGHVEAGLRTGRLDAPFPEEANRLIAGRLAAVHFAPTESARANLLREGTDPAAVVVTGNTVIDALLETARHDPPLAIALDPSSRLILVTAHRRDSFGAPLRRVCGAISQLVQKHPDIQVLWPVHPNPAVGPVVEEMLGHLPRVTLTRPLDYGAFVAALCRSYLVLTDSGGVQEEAPALGKPVLVLRDESERPEAVEAGVAALVGTETTTIVRAANRLLGDPLAYRAMARGVSPYGDGRAAERIVAEAARVLGIAALS
jgi:UDP-N-acetylglucosamine 2-epimerase (non-hydrolysing)